MRSKGNAPTAAQKRWREAVRSLGSVISGAPAVIHHPIGHAGKHNKVDIGHWWIIPLTDDEHKALHQGEYKAHRKAREKEMFQSVLDKLTGLHAYPPVEVYDAIMDYHL